MAANPDSSAADAVFSYHVLTKHHPGRFAPSPGYLDWANEPDPFRHYEGVERLRLTPTRHVSAPGPCRLYKRVREGTGPLSLDAIGAFLELSMGLSAWKSYGGSTWALRMNPSSGNLHPTETYLIVPPVPGMGDGGVFHYSPLLHSLHRRMSVGRDLWNALRDSFSAEGFIVGLSTIHWREAWKYGERAFRYCNHDVGHALACLSFAANLQGWQVKLLNELSDRDIEVLLGFDRTEWHESEREYGDLLCFIHSSNLTVVNGGIPREIVLRFGALTVEGTPNRLSKEHVRWGAIENVLAATEKPATNAPPLARNPLPYLCEDASWVGAEEVIRRRRSGQAYDGVTALPRKDFFCMLDRTVPRQGFPPFDLGLGETLTHLVLYVHRVEGLVPGLYLLIRDREEEYGIRKACGKGVRFEAVDRAPEGLALYFLHGGDLRGSSSAISCGQNIAGDGAFAVSMVSRFRDVIEREPFAYRRLFWEAGMIGQVLYLEAEIRGFRGTGIGCYFDDLVHELLGFEDDSYQCIYNFTVGMPVEDPRILTLPPYHHLREE